MIVTDVLFILKSLIPSLLRFEFLQVRQKKKRFEHVKKIGGSCLFRKEKAKVEFYIRETFSTPLQVFLVLSCGLGLFS